MKPAQIRAAARMPLRAHRRFRRPPSGSGPGPPLRRSGAPQGRRAGSRVPARPGPPLPRARLRPWGLCPLWPFCPAASPWLRVRGAEAFSSSARGDSSSSSWSSRLMVSSSARGGTSPWGASSSPTPKNWKPPTCRVISLSSSGLTGFFFREVGIPLPPVQHHLELLPLGHRLFLFRRGGVCHLGFLCCWGLLGRRGTLCRSGGCFPGSGPGRHRPHWRPVGLAARRAWDFSAAVVQGCSSLAASLAASRPASCWGGWGAGSASGARGAGSSCRGAGEASSPPSSSRVNSSREGPGRRRRPGRRPVQHNLPGGGRGDGGVGPEGVILLFRLLGRRAAGLFLFAEEPGQQAVLAVGLIRGTGGVDHLLRHLGHAGGEKRVELFFLFLLDFLPGQSRRSDSFGILVPPMTELSGPGYWFVPARWAWIS